MEINKIIENIRIFIDHQAEKGKNITVYEKELNPEEFFKKIGINVGLDDYKEIILQDETKFELGGVNKKSFSLIYPLHILDFIKDGKITLIGPEIKNITEKSIDFGIFILIGFEKISEKDFDNLRQFNFISNGIEGFMIRTIPRRFWCRINTEVMKKKFSFEFLGNAILFLYKQKFKDSIKSMEIIFISSNPDSIENFIEITTEIREHLSKKWKDKIEEWKKRIDCDYDWECDECPYYDICEDVKEVLEEREEIEK